MLVSTNNDEQHKKDKSFIFIDVSMFFVTTANGYLGIETPKGLVTTSVFLSVFSRNTSTITVISPAAMCDNTEDTVGMEGLLVAKSLLTLSSPSTLY